MHETRVNLWSYTVVPPTRIASSVKFGVGGLECSDMKYAGIRMCGGTGIGKSTPVE